MYSPLTVTATRYISNVWNTILMQQFFTACIVHWLLQLQVTLAMYEACNVARHGPHTALYVLLLLPTLTLAVHTWICCTIADLQRLTFIYLQQRCVGLLTSIVRQSLRHRQLHTHTRHVQRWEYSKRCPPLWLRYHKPDYIKHACTHVYVCLGRCEFSSFACINHASVHTIQTVPDPL